MNRIIKFRAWDNGEMFQMAMVGVPANHSVWTSSNWRECTPDVIIMQFTGLKDKNGVEIYEGDEILYKVPYRTTQTHTGDNIPNGSYTEPMEPGIKNRGGIIIFKDGMFQVDGDDESFDDESYPLNWAINEWELESIKEAISRTRQNADWFEDPEEGDLQYLIAECAKVKTADELIQYLNGVEIIGNIFQPRTTQQIKIKGYE